MMSKLQHVINYMDMYRILKETFLAWKGGGGQGLTKQLLYWLEYQSVILDDCHITNFADQDYNVSITLCIETFTDPNLNVQVMVWLFFPQYQRLWLYNGAPLVASYDTLGIRRTYSRLKPPASSRGRTGHVFAFSKVNFERQQL